MLNAGMTLTAEQTHVILLGCIESSEKAPFLRLNIVHKWASMTAPLSTEGEMSVCGLKVGVAFGAVV